MILGRCCKPVKICIFDSLRPRLKTRRTAHEEGGVRRYGGAHLDDLGALGWDSKYGYGLVDADEAADVEAPPSTGDTMHVASIDMTLKSTGPWVRAIATVTIVDTADSPVEGATVSGSWTGAVAGTDSAVTDSAGQAVFQSDKVRSPSSGTTFTFCVEAVVKSGWNYDPEDDVETCSSIVVP